MINRFRQVGFSSQRLLKADMNYVARLVSAGLEPDQVKGEIACHLDKRLAGGLGSDRGSRQKLTTLLTGIWLPTSAKRCEFVEDAVDFYQRSGGPERDAVLWGLVISTYPFWGAVAGTVGRLMNLQMSFSSKQVYRRLTETYGDRELVYRATRTVLRSFLDWGVIGEGESKGNYTRLRPSPIGFAELIGWLMEAYLFSREHAQASPRAIISSPVYFPFLFDQSAIPVALARKSLEVARHGLDEDLLMLKLESS